MGGGGGGGGDAANTSPVTTTGTTTATTSTNSGPSKTATALAPGFRFHPTDEELVRYYLTRKVRGKPFKLDAVAEVDIYKSEPWDLPGLSRLASRDMEWYFFGALDKKYGNGARMNRATATGYWKATGNDRPVSHNSRTIGMKKTLVFHKGRAPDGKRTDWVMHEYRLSDQELDKAGVLQDGYVLCKVFEKRGLGPPNGKQYAPFVEDDWDDNDNDDTSLFLPAATTDDLDDQRNAPVVDHDPFQCKNEKQDDGPNLPTIYDPEPFLQKKRPRGDTPEIQMFDLNIGGSSSLSRKTTTTQNPPPRRFDIATFDLSVHPSYLELIDKLQKEIHNISIERETLKMEVMNAQAMITVLHSRLSFLNKENHDLKARLPP